MRGAGVLTPSRSNSGWVALRPSENALRALVTSRSEGVRTPASEPSRPLPRPAFAETRAIRG